MGLNLNPHNNQGGLNLNAQVNPQMPNLFGGGQKALLYVIKPYAGQYTDVALRPLMYRFDENFTGLTHEAVNHASTGNVSRHSIMNQLGNHINLADHLIPSSHAEMEFKATNLSSNYRFILILTETAGNLALTNTFGSGGGNNTRRIYTGYFTDEPYNPRTFGSNSVTPNPHARIVITHKTLLGTTQESGPLGGFNKLNTYESQNIIQPIVTQAMTANVGHGTTDNTFHLMSPDTCTGTIDVNNEGQVFFHSAGESSLKNHNSPIVLHGILEQTQHNVGHVIKGLITEEESQIGRRHLPSIYGGLSQVGGMFDEEFGGVSFGRASLSRTLQLTHRVKQSPFDLDINQSISLVDIQAMVNGDLDIQPIHNEDRIYGESADQMQTSMTNQYSHLIAAVVAPVMDAAGINRMVFEYSIRNNHGMIEDDFVTHAALTNWTVSEMDRVQMAKAVEVELKTSILKTIFDTVGDYYVHVDASAIGDTKVSLSLVQMGYKNEVPFSFPTCLGGLVSPLIGNSLTLGENAAKLEEMYSEVTGRSGNGYVHDAAASAFGSMAEAHATQTELGWALA